MKNPLLIFVILTKTTRLWSFFLYLHRDIHGAIILSGKFFGTMYRRQSFFAVYVFIIMLLSYYKGDWKDGNL